MQGNLVAALDGIEILSRFSRCCPDCLQWRIKCASGDGQVVERIQYYHRGVGCQIVSSLVKAFLGLEWVAPGEGEDKAARRGACRTFTAAASSTSCCWILSTPRLPSWIWPRKWVGG